MRNKRFPKYPDDTDYNTNSPSYYDDLARKQKLIQLLAEKIWEYENTLDETLEQIEQRLTDYILENDLLMNERLENWDQRIDDMPEEMRSLFVTWLNDGTLEQIINHDVLGNKADKTFVDSEIERLDQTDENLITQMAKKARLGQLPKLPSNASRTTGNVNVYIGMDKNSKVFRNYHGVLQVSDDLIEWKALYTFPYAPTGVRQLDNGELLVSLGQSATVKSTLYLSNGYGTDNLTFTKVLESFDYFQIFDLGWSFGGKGNIYVVTAYDTKAVGQRSTSQPVWLTTDYGKTWDKIYDHGTGSLSNNHVHGCFYDHYRKAIWVSLGDNLQGEPSIIVSWDLGNTWQTVSTDHQPTVIYPFPDCVIFGQDSIPNGVLRINNPSPTHLDLEVGYKLNNNSLLTHIAGNWFKLDDSGPLLIPFSTAVSGHQGLVLGTYDGHSFFKVWEDTVNNDGITSVAKPFGPTKNGQYVIRGTRNGIAFNVTIDNLHNDVITRDSVASSYANLITPKITYFTIGNEANPFTPIPRGEFTPIKFGNQPFAYKRFDSTQLFTSTRDYVMANRDCIVHMTAHISYDWRTTQGGARIQLNGQTLVTSQKQQNISVSVNLLKGDKITVDGYSIHPEDFDSNVGGTSYLLSMIAIEVW